MLCLFDSISTFAKTLFYDDTTKTLGLNYNGTNDSGKANTYYNTFGTNEYEEKYGLIVPTLNNWLAMWHATGATYVNDEEFCENLTGNLMATDLEMIMLAAEMEVFKLNNPSVNFVDSSYKDNTSYAVPKYSFAEWGGQPVWVKLIHMHIQ